MLRGNCKTPDVVFTSPNFHSRTKRPVKNSNKKSLALRCLLPLFGRHPGREPGVVCTRNENSLGQNGTELGFFWVGFSRALLVGIQWVFGSKSICLMEHIQVQEYQNNYQDENYYMTSNKFLART